jgi:DNA invertase Pin-like site-specific DNA recombinase
MSHSKITSITVDSRARAVEGARRAYTEQVKAPERGTVGGKPKAYSYVRFSTPDQMEGDSFERQTRKAAEYATAHGLELDTSLTFRDLGVSGYRGANAERGSLADFRFAVQHGDVAPGSYLLIESFDRLSRMEPWDALPIFQEIVNAGITIVTLQDNKEWSREAIRGNPWRILESLIVMMRAHEESAIKSMRVASAYERKRERAAGGDKSKPFTRMLPGWLSWDDESKQFKVREDRAAIVRAIFSKAIEGWGQHKIAHWLNAQGIPTWGRASQWHRSYVRKILANPAVIGTFTPHKKLVDGNGKRRRKAVDTVEAYFPVVVEREMFDSVALRSATTAPRGRHANRALKSLFSGVLCCSQCGATVSRVSKGKGEHVYLVCAKAYSRAGTHQYQAVRYELIEGQFRRWARGIIADAPRSNDEDLEQRIRQCTVNIDAAEMLVGELVEELLDRKSDALRKRLQQVEAELEKSRDELRTLIARRDTLAPERVERKLQALLEALTRKPFDVVATNAAMRQAVRKIVMNVEEGELAIYWHHTADDADPQVVPFSRFQRVPTRNKRKQRPKQPQPTPATPINS